MKTLGGALRGREAGVLVMLVIASLLTVLGTSVGTAGVGALQAAGTGNWQHAMQQPAPTVTATPPTPPRPLDLVADRGFDPNGIPLNPRWGYQTPTGPGNPTLTTTDPRQLTGCNPIFINRTAPRIVNPSCTGQSPSWDEPAPGSWNSTWCNRGAIRDGGAGPGHSNWFPATYTGTINFDGHSNSVYDDDDYSMNLYSPDSRGGLAGDNGRVHAEFSSDETIDNFGTRWWSAFHEAVDNSGSILGGYSDAAEQMIGGHRAIVTGFMGIDWVHPPGAESHPVWALAIEDSYGNWSFFVRNWGNEGYCSDDDQHYLDGLPGATSTSGGTYTFKLPWETGYGPRGQVIPATSVSILPPEIHARDRNSSNGFPGNEVDIYKVERYDPRRPDQQGVYVTFHLEPGPSQSFYDGTINLGWNFPAGTNPPPPPPPPPDPHCHKVGGCGDGSPEAFVEGKLGPLLSPSQYLALKAKLDPQRTPDRPLNPHAIHVGSLPQPPPLPHRRPTTTAVFDPEIAWHYKLQQALLCSIFGGKIPGFPTACLPPTTHAGESIYVREPKNPELRLLKMF